VGSFVSPNLKIGTTLAIVQDLGKIPLQKAKSIHYFWARWTYFAYYTFRRGKITFDLKQIATETKPVGIDYTRLP